MQTASVTNFITDFSVNLDFFSGPMDLLLHLVEQQEIEIEKIDLRQLCDQYLEIITRSTELDLERAGEYLVVAATLTARKSEALLPVLVASEELEGIDSFDSRFFTELRERLLAFRETKERALKLLAHAQLGIDEFTARRTLAPEPSRESGEEISGDGNLIARYFYQLLKRIGDAGRKLSIRLEPIVVVEFMVSIVDHLTAFRNNTQSFAQTKLGFFNLVKSLCHLSPMGSRSKLTGTFVATLELVRRGILVAEVHDESFVVELRQSIAQDELRQFSSEFDEGENSSDKVIVLSRYRKDEILNSTTQLDAEERRGVG